MNSTRDLLSSLSRTICGHWSASRPSCCSTLGPTTDAGCHHAVLMFHYAGLPDRRYDDYVIGAGPAGITIALALARANRTVLVFETGTVTEARDDMPNAVNYGHFRDGWWDRHSIRAFGGTSRVWNGWCATLMEVDFNNPAAGVRWPITKSDLAPHYRRAAAVVDREPSILDVETPLIPGFAYRPFSWRRPTRFGRKYLEALGTSLAS